MNFAGIPGIFLTISGVVYFIGLVASLLVASYPFALGFGAGGALVLLNVWASARKVKKTDFLHKGSVMASLVGGFYLRLFLMGICLFGLIRFSSADPVGLVTGLSVVPAGLFVLLVLIYIANRRPEEV